MYNKTIRYQLFILNKNGHFVDLITGRGFHFVAQANVELRGSKDPATRQLLLLFVFEF
jgi:hypothetical protein